MVSGEITGQGLRIASKSLWDTNYDNWTSYTYQNDSMYCTAMVFAVYYEWWMYGYWKLINYQLLLLKREY